MRTKCGWGSKCGRCKLQSNHNNIMNYHKLVMVPGYCIKSCCNIKSESVISRTGVAHNHWYNLISRDTCTCTHIHTATLKVIIHFLWVAHTYYNTILRSQNIVLGALLKLSLLIMISSKLANHATKSLQSYSIQKKS